MSAMTKSQLFTILLSAIISAVVSGGITHWQEAQKASVGRFSKIEILDSENQVRATIGIVRIGGKEIPQFTLGDDESRPSVLLRTNDKAEGTLYFSSEQREGIVSLGYLLGSDVTDEKGRAVRDFTDSTSAWGVQVYGPDGHSTSIGVSNTHRVSEPAKSTPR